HNNADVRFPVTGGIMFIGRHDCFLLAFSDFFLDKGPIWRKILKFSVNISYLKQTTSCCAM
ncbi:hypothetical protein, partial [Neisseria dentiae]|uniref:hypothetical protein n=1 Tax=Neisseria dentiae TaxID=194197 RepID=UPI00359F1C49